jgi:6-phosphogluconolactonase
MHKKGRAMMFQKVLLTFLTLILTLAGAVSVFAQEAPTDASATRLVYLPLVNGGQPTASDASAALVEEDWTDTLDAVEAAGGSGTGFVFVSTNAVDAVRGNEVVMYRRAADGLLTVTGRFPTGGQGLGSGLGSQSAVSLSNNGRWLFVVNAGSNEISVFSVQAAGLILTDNVPSGGVRPTSLTVYKNLLYVLNAGDPGNITGFKLNQAGKLTPLANSTLPLSNNGMGAAPAPAQVSFSPAGDALVVTERATNLINTYKVHKNGLASGPTVHNSSGVTPFGFAFTHQGTLVVSEAFGGATDASAVSSYAVSGDNFQLISASVPTGQTAACWVVVTQDGRYAYSTNAGSASLAAYRVDAGGNLTLINGRAGVTGDGTGPTDVAVSRNSRLLYALSPRSQTILGFAVQADGSLVALGSFGELQAGPAGIAVW